MDIFLVLPFLTLSQFSNFLVFIIKNHFCTVEQLATDSTDKYQNILSMIDEVYLHVLQKLNKHKI